MKRRLLHSFSPLLLFLLVNGESRAAGVMGMFFPPHGTPLAEASFDWAALATFGAGAVALAAVMRAIRYLSGQKDAQPRTIQTPLVVKPEKEFATKQELQIVDGKVESLRDQIIPKSEVVTHKDLGHATAAIIAAGAEREERMKKHTDEAIAKCFALILDHEGKLGTHDGLIDALRQLRKEHR